jgi:hypothetical protein
MYRRSGTYREGEMARIEGVEYLCGRESGIFPPSGHPESEREAA